MKYRGYIYLIVAALAYASMGVLVKFLSHELTPLWQVFLRLIVSASMALIFLKLQKKKLFLSAKKLWPVMIFMGIFAYGSSMIAYTYAFNFTKVANVLFILSIYPLLTTLFAKLFLKEKLTNNHIIALFVLIIGTVLIFNPSDIFKYFIGNMLSLYVAITFSFYLVISRFLNNKGEGAETITFLSIVIGAAFAGFCAIIFENIPTALSLPTLIGVLLFGFLNFTAHICVNLGLKTVKVSTGTMILMLEAVVGSILAYIFFKEIPTILFIFGAILVIFSIYISTRSQKY